MFTGRIFNKMPIRASSRLDQCHRLMVHDSFNANTFNHSYSIRISSKLRIPIDRTEYYHRSFLISGCNAWNKLPDYIRKSVSLNSFKFNMFKYLLAKTQF